MEKLEYRKFGEVRNSTDEGIVEAYLTAWGTVDSYKTSFQRGSFAKTFTERGHKIRLIWNHEVLAGKVLECREDDYGPFVKVQFNLDTTAGKDAFNHVRAGDVDAFSFGFAPINDKPINGIRTFTEVKVYECGPAVFEANGAATITDARAQDFSETVAQSEIRNRGWKLFYALENTIDDIYWMDQPTESEVKGLVDKAISDFHGAYMAWLDEYYQQFTREDPKKFLTRTGNKIQEAIKNAEGMENITRETSLTGSDIDRLKNGKLLVSDSRLKLAELPEEIRNAHQEERRNTVENLCSEIRESGFSESDKQRFNALLGLGKEPVSETQEALNSFETLRKSIRKED